jgi:hypothetical protein
MQEEEKQEKTNEYLLAFSCKCRHFCLFKELIKELLILLSQCPCADPAAQERV